MTNAAKILVRRTLPPDEEIHGHQAQRIAAFDEEARWLLHRESQVGAPLSGTGDARVGGATVNRHIRAGRSDRWHTHPVGRTLLVLTCLGRVQRDGISLATSATMVIGYGTVRHVLLKSSNGCSHNSPLSKQPPWITSVFGPLPNEPANIPRH